MYLYCFTGYSAALASRKLSGWSLFDRASKCQILGKKYNESPLNGWKGLSGHGLAVGTLISDLFRGTTPLPLTKRRTRLVRNKQSIHG